MYTEMQRVYFIYTGCFNLNLHSGIYVSPELCPIALLSSAVILSYRKAADNTTLYTREYSHYLIFTKKFLLCNS